MDVGLSTSSSSFRLCSSSVRCSPSHVDAIHFYFLQFWFHVVPAKNPDVISPSSSLSYLLSYSLALLPVHYSCCQYIVISSGSLSSPSPFSLFYCPYDVSYSNFLSYLCAFNPVMSIGLFSLRAVGANEKSSACIHH